MLVGVSTESLLESLGQYEDRLLLVGSDGQIEREISVLRALMQRGLEHLLFDMSVHSRFDPTHVNDIEVVTSALAEKIDGALEGDLLISIRQLHMLAILDQNTDRLKWHHTGPWIRQHDPDITDDGDIELFNNKVTFLSARNAAENPPNGSNIMTFDPVSGQTSLIYPVNDQESFATPNRQ